MTPATPAMQNDDITVAIRCQFETCRKTVAPVHIYLDQKCESCFRFFCLSHFDTMNHLCQNRTTRDITVSADTKTRHHVDSQTITPDSSY